MRRAWGNTADLLLLTLRENGPSTTLQLADELGLHRDQVASVLTRMRKPGKRGPYAGHQRAHVAGWHWESVNGARPYLRPIYAAGPGGCAPKPPARRARRRQKQTHG